MERSAFIANLRGFLWSILVVWSFSPHDCSGAEMASIDLLREAKRFVCEQQHIKAYEALLRSVESIPRDGPSQASEGEVQAFDQLFEMYEQSSVEQDKSWELLNKIRQVITEHPDYHLLRYYQAACLANLGEYSEFFDTFFQAISLRPDSFMACKIIGVIHLRLYEGLSDESLRMRHRAAAIEALEQALRKDVRDISLLIKLAFLLPRDGQVGLLRRVCSDILAHDRALKRADCWYIIRFAISLGLYDEASLLLGASKRWYAYSRMCAQLSEELVTAKRQAISGIAHER